MALARFAAVLLMMAAAPGQTPAPAAGSAGSGGSLTVDSQLKSQYAGAKRLFTALADTMPAEQYGFQPTPEMRTFAGGIAHEAATNFAICANLTGQPNPRKGVDLEKTLTSKADATKALAESFAFCDGFVSTLSAQSMKETYAATIVAGGERRPLAVMRGGLLANLVEHSNEMYGYLSVYLRLKGLVPPSSQSSGSRGGHAS